MQFLSPKVQFFLLTIWKFQLFFVSLQCKKEYLKRLRLDQKSPPNSPPSRVNRLKTALKTAARNRPQPALAQLPIRLTHNPNPPRARPHVGADHLPQPLREEGSKRSARTITNKWANMAGRHRGLPLRVEHSSVTYGACLCKKRSIALYPMEHSSISDGAYLCVNGSM